MFHTYFLAQTYKKRQAVYTIAMQEPFQFWHDTLSPIVMETWFSNMQRSSNNIQWYMSSLDMYHEIGVTSPELSNSSCLIIPS